MKELEPLPSVAFVDKWLLRLWATAGVIGVTTLLVINACGAGGNGHPVPPPKVERNEPLARCIARKNIAMNQCILDFSGDAITKCQDDASKTKCASGDAGQ